MIKYKGALMKTIKKSMQIMAVVIIGISYWPLSAMALTLHNDKQSTESKDIGIESLQIPEKFEITIDPLEINGRGQIFSEEYMIKNSGDTAGTLVLSDFVCQPQKKSGTTVKTDKTGIHNNSEKSIYIEAVFGNGNRVILSQPDVQYKAELNPGEQLTLTFSGEVNENAFRKWENDDVIISMFYSWDTARTASEKLDEQVMDNVAHELEKIPEESNLDSDSEKIIDDIEIKENTSNSEIETLDNKESNNIKDVSDNLTYPVLIVAELKENNSQKEGGSDKAKFVGDLQIPEKIKITADQIEVGGTVRIYSEQYLIRNSGDMAGKLILSDLKCKPQEESQIIVKTDKSGIQDNEEKSIYIEAVLENEDKVILSKSDDIYEVELNPGEELLISFSGDINEKTIKQWKNNEVEVSIIYSWDIEEDTSNENNEKEFLFIN